MWRGSVCGFCFDYIGIYRTCVEPQMKRTPSASHVHSSSVCSESLVAVLPDRSSSCEYFTSWWDRERKREEERGCKLGIGERRGFGAEVNNWKNLSPGGIYSSPVVGRRGDVCWEGSSLNGMPKGERRGGEWVRGRSCKKIWNCRAVVGGDLKGYLQARRGPRGRQRGNHWKQSKGVPRTQKINQSFSTSYVQLVWLYFFLSTFESSEAQLLSP